ncbi:GmrSD restriction endonuclease domain-containing protein [Embleya sp. MST-111070]|uniref:GmrSD restriction endonuclease domain-containing protein n=1 Tax=Embleya sp. MST-111070 TaxID=3398231 RepID=UPI003F739933
MARTLYKDTTGGVDHLVAEIRRGDIALPELQRPFVWKATQVRDLFDSMYKGFPVGSLLFWLTGAEPGARQIGTNIKDHAPRALVVDGQQRLTALYAVLTGEPVLRGDYSTGRIRIAFRPADATFAVTDAAIEKDPEYLADVSTLWQPGNRKPTIRRFIDGLTEKRELDQDERDRLETALEELHDLNKSTFKVVELDADIDEEQVAEIFVRINSEGVKLNQADFILTLMSVYWPAGRVELERFCRDAREPVLTGASPFNWYIRPEADQLLRVTTTLALRRAVLKQVYTILRGRDPETGKPSADLRKVRFAGLQAAQERVLDLTNWHEFLQCLERAGYRGSKMISSDNAVLFSYLMWLIGRVDHQVPLDRLRESIARWFFMAQLTSRYSGSFETRVEQDLNRLHAVPSGDAAAYLAVLDRTVEATFTPDFWSITLPNSLEASGAKSPAQLAYVAALNVLDAEPLLSTTRVRSRMDPAVLTKKGIERHHLFPRNHLKKTGVNDTQRINQVANMALVEWHDNIEISDRPPADYWPSELASTAMTPERLARHMYWHALPQGWESMSYDDFLPARRTLIAEVVRDAYARLREPNYAPTYPTVSATNPPQERWIRLGDLIDAGLLTPPTRLTPARDGQGVEAVVDARGRITLDGEEFDSPSPAASRSAGVSTNGWLYWNAHLDDGPVLLDELRSEYRRKRS